MCSWRDTIIAKTWPIGKQRKVGVPRVKLIQSYKEYDMQFSAIHAKHRDMQVGSQYRQEFNYFFLVLPWCFLYQSITRYAWFAFFVLGYLFFYISCLFPVHSHGIFWPMTIYSRYHIEIEGDNKREGCMGFTATRYTSAPIQETVHRKCSMGKQERGDQTARIGCQNSKFILRIEEIRWRTYSKHGKVKHPYRSRRKIFADFGNSCYILASLIIHNWGQVGGPNFSSILQSWYPAIVRRSSAFCWNRIKEFSSSEIIDSA